MPDINPGLPVVGQPDSTEEPKVVTALSQLIAAVNDVDSAQVKDGTLTLADLVVGASGMAQGAFSAYRTGAHSRLGGEVIVFDTDTAPAFDVSGWFDTATGIFTPQTAGYYRLSASVGAGTVLTADVFWQASLMKNAAEIHRGQIAYQRGAAQPVQSAGSWVVQANGTTDTFKVAIQHNVGAAQPINVSPLATFFQGEFIGKG